MSRIQMMLLCTAVALGMGVLLQAGEIAARGKGNPSANRCPRQGGTVVLRDRKNKTIRKTFKTRAACVNYLNRHPHQRIVKASAATPTPRVPPTASPTATPTSTALPTSTPSPTPTQPPTPTATAVPTATTPGSPIPGGPGTPSITFTYVPAYGHFDNLAGQVLHVNPHDYMVAVYIYVGTGWWTKPYADSPGTTINDDGTFTTDITTGGVDETATVIAAFLVPSDFSIPVVLGDATLPAALNQFPHVEVSRAP